MGERDSERAVVEKFIKYVGLTYKPSAREDTVVDCWGLIVVLYRDLYGIHLPKYETCSVAKDGQQGTAEFLLQADLYKQCKRVELNEVQEGDLLLLMNAGLPTHIGMIIDHEYMIHCFDKAGSVIESYRSNKWRTRIQAAYRHPSFI